MKSVYRNPVELLGALVHTVRTAPASKAGSRMRAAGCDRGKSVRMRPAAPLPTTLMALGVFTLAEALSHGARRIGSDVEISSGRAKASIPRHGWRA